MAQWMTERCHHSIAQARLTFDLKLFMAWLEDKDSRTLVLMDSSEGNGVTYGQPLSARLSLMSERCTGGSNTNKGK
jgi:hypothetical protein